MDAKDVRIFCEIAFKGLDYDSFTDRRVSPLAIGRKLGLDEKTVRLRVKKMENDGFIKYYQAMPSLALFQLKNTNTYRFEALNITTKHLLVKYVQELPFIVEAIDYLGQVASVSISGASSDETDQVASELANRFELYKWILGSRIIKEPASVGDILDWQIIQELRYDALSGVKDLSKSLSITPRMIEYRIKKLLGSGTLLVRAMINSQKQEGLIFYELEISVDERRQYNVIKQLSEIYAEKLWSVRTLAAGILLGNFFAFTLAEPEEAYVNTLKLEGVKSCSLFIFKETVEPKRPNWIDSLIDQKIAQTSKFR
ncbi:MAG: Lrp/AsnC family transcriptional regulator [Thermoproteota archaeon]|nr:Lrp/AsnC family transcriptional regulator [Thermoproteota archaeon]